MNLKTKQRRLQKLKREELKEIVLLIRYYQSLDLDCDVPESSPKSAERDILNGLNKLLINYYTLLDLE